MLWFIMRSLLGPKHSYAGNVDLCWHMVGTLCWICPWVKEAVSPKFIPTPLLIIVGDTKSWTPCLSWDNSAGAFQLHSSQLAEASVATASLLASPSVQCCCPHCSQALFQRAFLNKPAAWKFQGPTMWFGGKPTYDTRSSPRKETLRWGFGSWMTSWQWACRML